MAMDPKCGLEGVLSPPHETKSLQKEAEIVATDWRRKRLKYLKNKTLTSALECAVLYPASDSELTPEDRDKIASALALSKAQDFQGLNSKRKFDFGGRMREALAKELLKELRRTCNALLSHYDTEETRQLPELVSEDLASINKNFNSKRMLTEQLRRRSTTLARQLSVLLELIEKHYLSSAPESNRIQAAYLSAKANTLMLKYKSLEKEVQALTYTRKTNANLEKIRDGLRQTFQETKRQVEKSQGEVAKYDAIAGQDLEEMVRAYSAVLSDIKGREWVVDGLTRGKK